MKHLLINFIRRKNDVQFLRFLKKIFKEPFNCLIVLTIISFSCEQKGIRKHLNYICNQPSSVQGIKVTYPFAQTIFPPEIFPPTFMWVDTSDLSMREWYVFIHDSSGKKIFIKDKAKATKWRPDSIKWEKLKKENIERKIYFTAIGYSTLKKAYSTGQITFTFSRDSVGAEIFFRAVTIPFSFAVKNVHTIEWYLGSVKGGSPRLMLKDLPVCGNCHSFPASGKPLLAMDVDYGNDKGSYTIASIEDTCRLKPDNIISWSNFKREENEPTFGLLSQISPDGNYVLSTVKDLSVFVAIDDNLAYSQLFFPIKGIIGVYDVEKKTFYSLSGADNPKYVQSNPSWSPDGKEIIFAQTEAYINEKVRQSGRALLSVKDVKEFTHKRKTFKFDLYRIKFNDGKGGIAEPIPGASNNGKSNYFAKYSPNGKWIVFCQAENFMLLQPDAELYIMPASGGNPRRMNCNLPSMNSWHSWSPNSKWLVFSSKYRGLYTQLYLTHIDENGNDSPPVLLENLVFEKRAANIPEFYPGDAKKFKAIKDEFSNTAPYFVQLSADNMVNGYYKRAWDNLEHAIRIDSNYLEAYVQRILLNATLQQNNSIIDRKDKQKALQLVDQLLAKHPNQSSLLLIRATLLSGIGKTNEALEITYKIRSIEPNNYKNLELMASLYRRKKQFGETISIYKKMAQLVPHNINRINLYIAEAYEAMGKYNEALNIINAMIQQHPYWSELKIHQIQIAILKNDRTFALNELEALIKEENDNDALFELLAQLNLNDPQKYINYINISLKILDKKLEGSPEDVLLLLKKANLYAALREWKKAIITLNRILELS